MMAEICTECGNPIDAHPPAYDFQGRMVCALCDSRLQAAKAAAEAAVAHSQPKTVTIPDYWPIKILAKTLRVIGYLSLILGAAAALSGLFVCIFSSATGGPILVIGLAMIAYGFPILIVGECLLAFRDAVQNTFYFRRLK